MSSSNMPISISSSTTSTRRLAEADLVIWLEYPCAIESELNECWLNRSPRQAVRASRATDIQLAGTRSTTWFKKSSAIFPAHCLNIDHNANSEPVPCRSVESTRAIKMEDHTWTGIVSKVTGNKS